MNFFQDTGMFFCWTSYTLKADKNQVLPYKHGYMESFDIEPKYVKYL